MSIRNKSVGRPAGVTVFPLACVAALFFGGCASRTGAELYPQFVEYAGREIEEVSFVGAEPFTEDTLQFMVETRESRCNLLGLPICLPLTELGAEEHFLDLETLAEDAARLALFYRRSGFFQTQVRPEVESAEDEDVLVTFYVERGDPVYLDALAVEGTETVLAADSLERTLPLQPGELFDLGEFDASADTVLSALRARGFAYADVLRNYTVERVANLATASLVAVPGPQVIVDSIVVLGAENLGREATLRQLTFREGELLRASELVESQRNLYSLELVQLATVSLASDTAPQTTVAPLVAPVSPGPGLPRGVTGEPGDSARATVVVRVAEAPVHLVEAALGFGTVECVRTRLRWVNRSFGGGARRLAVTGSVSKIGIGAPLDMGLSSVCRAFEGDPFADSLDYRLAAELTQPYFGSPRNHLTVAAFAEVQSEPRVFQRVAQGGRLALTRRLAPRSLLTVALDAERRRTRAATPVLFCIALLVCRPEDIDELSLPARWNNSVGATWILDRSLPVLDPVDGYRLGTGASWAAAWLGSQSRYVRMTGEAAIYREVRPEWVLAGSLRLGSFLGSATLDPTDADFILPENRFFAGGSNSVRGYGRNQLGPGVYVAGDSVVVSPETGFPQPVDTSAIDFFPVGGTSVMVGSVELRFPAPFMRDRLRMAVFLDAGAVGAGALQNVGSQGVRFTPGAGIRVKTPIGPVRLDMAYNPYGRPVAPLFVPAMETGELVRIDPAFQKEQAFWDRFRIHLAVGQPF